MKLKNLLAAIESTIAALAAGCLGCAVGFAVARLAPGGAGLAPAITAGVMVALAGWLTIARIDRRADLRGASFTPVEALAAMDGEEVVTPAEVAISDDCLLLDDPLPRLAGESRVVRLFAPQAGGPSAATPSAGPGEMIARIEDFLGHRAGAGESRPARPADPAASDEASAALHAALADIRRSLRQG